MIDKKILDFVTLKWITGFVIDDKFYISKSKLCFKADMYIYVFYNFLRDIFLLIKHVTRF